MVRVRRALYLPDPLDAFPNWKFWVLDGPSLPNPSHLFRYCFYILDPTHLLGTKGALEGEGCQDSEGGKLDL